MMNNKQENAVKTFKFHFRKLVWNRENNTINILINKYVLFYICVESKQTTGGVYGL